MGIWKFTPRTGKAPVLPARHFSPACYLSLEKTRNSYLEQQTLPQQLITSSICLQLNTDHWTAAKAVKGKKKKKSQQLFPKSNCHPWTLPEIGPHCLLWPLLDHRRALRGVGDEPIREIPKFRCHKWQVGLRARQSTTLDFKIITCTLSKLNYLPRWLWSHVFEHPSQAATCQSFCKPVQQIMCERRTNVKIYCALLTLWWSTVVTTQRHLQPIVVCSSRPEERLRIGIFHRSTEIFF